MVCLWIEQFGLLMEMEGNPLGIILGKLVLSACLVHLAVCDTLHCSFHTLILLQKAEKQFEGKTWSSQTLVAAV